MNLVSVLLLTPLRVEISEPGAGFNLIASFYLFGIRFLLFPAISTNKPIVAWIFRDYNSTIFTVYNV